MTEAVIKTLEKSAVVKRDPDAYQRYLHNKARYEKYGSGKHMELNMQPPKPEKVVKFEFTSEQCRGLAAIFKDMIDNGEFPLEEDEA